MLMDSHMLKLTSLTINTRNRYELELLNGINSRKLVKLQDSFLKIPKSVELRNLKVKLLLFLGVKRNIRIGYTHLKK